MDLRPTRCREMALAIYDNMIARGLSDDPEVMNPIIDEWVDLMVPIWTSHSLTLPNGRWVSTRDGETAQAYIAKYPRLQELIDLCKAEALRRWPEATFSLEVNSDPEGCHLCCEGQRLTLEIQTDLDFEGPNGEEYPLNSPYNAASNQWSKWQHGWYEDDDEEDDTEPPDDWDQTPYRVLSEDIGTEVAWLLSINLQWKREPEPEPEPSDE